MQYLSTEHSSRAYLSELDSRESMSVVGPVEVLLHSEEQEHHLEREGSAWSRVKSAGYDSSEAIELQEETEVDHRAGFTSNNDSCFQDEHSSLNR